jgi:hypothetical protein
MAAEYDMNWEQLIRILMPDAQYTGKQEYPNRAGYAKDIVWNDARPKPTWEALTAIWTHPTNPGSGVRHDRNSPGDIKMGWMATDHGNWLYIDPTAGRVLERDDYPILFYVLGTSHNVLYPAITVTQFGLPIPGGRFPIIAGIDLPMGTHGGSQARVNAAAGQGNPNSPTTQPYWVAGNLFMFAGELRSP